MTGIVQRLETRKLVKRMSNNADGRVVHLHLTPAGSRANKPTGVGTIERAARTALGRCSVAQQKATAAMIGEFAAELMKL
ncbi:MAG: hypothetical protein QM736_26810 [Vicinamibacterales bacterium]